MPIQLETKVFRFEMDAKAVTDAGDFEGYGSVFGNVDMGSDVVVEGAFAESLAEWKSKGGMPAMYWMHDMSLPIGDWLEMSEDKRGLFSKGTLWVEGNSLGRSPIAEAAKAHNVARSNGPKGLSIGYSATKESYGDHEGRRVRFLEKVQLWEVSVVGFGMNPAALITNAKSQPLVVGDDVVDIKTFEKVLRDAGLSRQQSKAFLAGGYKALLRDAEENDVGSLVESLANLLTKIQ